MAESYNYLDRPPLRTDVEAVEDVFRAAFVTPLTPGQIEAAVAAFPAELATDVKNWIVAEERRGRRFGEPAAAVACALEALEGDR